MLLWRGHVREYSRRTRGWRKRPNDYVVAVDVTASLWNKEDLGNPVRLATR